MRGCINGCRSPSPTMPLPSPQEPLVSERAFPRNGEPPPPRNALEAPGAVSTAATGELVNQALSSVSAEPPSALGPHARRACEWVGLACYLNTVSEITLCHW